MPKLAELLPFKRSWGNPKLAHSNLETLVAEGKLPPDILFRLLSIGEYRPDLTDDSEKQSRLYLALLQDAVNHADDSAKARPETQAIVWGELPDIVVDIGRNGPELYAQLPTLYWSKKQLTDVIQARRLSEGKTITEPSQGFWYTAEERERRHCSGLAQPMWRVLVERLHPDIIKHPEWFYHAATLSFNNVYDLSSPTRRRRAIILSRISDIALRRLYEEIETTGMKGIGPIGQRDLGAMLAPVHQDIMLRLAEQEGVRGIV